MRVLLFGGTREGRELSGLLAANGIEVVLFVATDYGKELVSTHPNVTVHARRLNEDEMLVFMKERAFDHVIDTTHPYAEVVTSNIRLACQKAGIQYLRLVRDKSEQNSEVIPAESAEAAAKLLKDTSGNILLTTGSKDLNAFTSIDNYAERIYVRMIPMIESLQKAEALGFQNKNMICMQGPFDFELNKAMLLSTGAHWLVTKDSGEAGGFSEKVSAALAIGCKVIVIARPVAEEGLTFSEILDFVLAGIVSKDDNHKAVNNRAENIRRRFDGQ